MKYFVIILFSIFLVACFDSSGDSENNQDTSKDIYTQDIKNLNENPAACTSENEGINWDALNTTACNWLSDYNLFSGTPNHPENIRSPGLPYELNSALFTDYAHKYRYIILPENTHVNFHTTETFDFPIGTVLVKVFALPLESYDNPQDKIIEVRLQIKRSHGWILIPYVWHPDSNDAYLHLFGKPIEHNFTHLDEPITFNYQIPSTGTCQQCHQDENGFAPIGPKARNLNRYINYSNTVVNQLRLWESLNMLEGLPADLSEIDTMPAWTDESHSLEDRAKAYLDINCAHCHSDHGAAALSGLRLEYWRKSLDHTHGVCNSSHGWRGGGYDIWPGEGEVSSITRRMNMTEAKDRMPPIGRILVDQKAVELMKLWIDSMPYQNCSE